jgi:hypothetical protein
VGDALAGILAQGPVTAWVTSPASSLSFMVRSNREGSTQKSERRPAEPPGALVAYVRSLRSCEPEALATVYSYEPEALAATPRLPVLLEVPQLDASVTRFFVPQRAGRGWPR